MFPKAGAKLGPYEILGELGGGGMARVYRAWDGRLHREVAIKVIDEDFDMPGIGERFLREARAASALNHPNICTIFDIGEQDGAPYLVMELLEGESLRERIDGGVVSVEDILRYGAEVSDALAAAHARGIVHRDIKPANIFLVKKPNCFAQAKVLDFGLAKVERYGGEERAFASNLTSMGATVGTVSYMSPEQARGEDLDARSDLFSLGIVMYEMATRQLPFRGNTSALVFVQLLGQMAPEPIRNLNGEMPTDLEQVIMKLLAKNTRARFQSAMELTDELHALAEKRSGWLTRLKTPPPVRPDDQPGSRAGSPVREDSAEYRSQQKTAKPVSDGKREGRSEQVQEASGERLSASKPVRTSIASNPKISYLTAAPYMGQSGVQRAFHSAEVKADGISAESREQASSGGISSSSGMRPDTPDASPTGTIEAVYGRVVPGSEEQTAPGDGVPWRWIALAVVLVVLLAGLMVWKFGWLRASPNGSSMNSSGRISRAEALHRGACSSA
jgi:serine/threonine protein kinase